MRLARHDDFGLVRVVRQEGDRVVIAVDRLQMLDGEAAAEAAAADGTDVSNDYYLVNDSHREREHRVSPDAVVWGSIRLSRTVEHQRVTREDWLAFVEGDAEGTLFHVEITDGEVTGVEEQYRP